MEKDYQNYVFDLDGTLINSLDDLAASTNYALRQYGLPEHSVEDVRNFVGNGVRKLIERAVPGGEAHPGFNAVLQTFRAHYLEHSLDKTRPYDGVMDMLEALSKRGKGLAVVSNKFFAATEELCRHFFGSLIPVAIGEREGIRRKPAPDGVLEAMRRLGATMENTVYVGDSEVDLATARNVGLPCISVLWGFRSRELLLSNGAQTFVESPMELVGE